MSNLTEDEIRKMVREMLMSGELSEYDLLYPKKQDWNIASNELKQNMSELIDNLQNDEYKEGIEKINKVIYKLKVWRHNIEKIIN